MVHADNLLSWTGKVLGEQMLSDWSCVAVNAHVVGCASCMSRGKTRQANLRKRRLEWAQARSFLHVTNAISTSDRAGLPSITFQAIVLK
jgi:hypothetical protein